MNPNSGTLLWAARMLQREAESPDRSDVAGTTGVPPGMVESARCADVLKRAAGLPAEDAAAALRTDLTAADVRHIADAAARYARAEPPRDPRVVKDRHDAAAALSAALVVIDRARRTT